MSFILYQGGEKTVRKQLACEHDWQGPGIADFRFYWCPKCRLKELDCGGEKDYYEQVRERRQYEKDTADEYLTDLVKAEREIKRLKGKS